MKLEIGNFHVKDVIFDSKTLYENGVLTINKDEVIKHLKEDDRLTDIDIFIAKPGESKRIVPVKAAVEPRCKISGGKAYPGVINDLGGVGDGITHALKGISVLSVGKCWGGFQDGLIDMSGAGAKYTYFSELINICIVGDTNEEFEKEEQQKKNEALRWAGMRLGEYLGEVVKNLEPEEVETYELDSILKRNSQITDLPSIVYVMQLDSQMKQLGYNSMVYGWDVNRMLPTLLHPNEVLDGAVVAGSFTPSSSIFSTYDLVNNPTIKRLYKEHGKTLNFAGVIISNNSAELEEKKRTTLFVSRLAKTIGVDAAIVVEQAYGNPDADFIGCIVALEDLGIKTVGVTTECTGRDGASQPLVVLDEKADAIVSTGNVSELIELPPMETVIGNLESLGRDGFAGGWNDDDVLGPSVREDGSIIMENNSIFIGDATCGLSVKTVKEF